MTTVDFGLITSIREHINRTEKQSSLLAERKKWLQLTAALDVLEDTSWAVEYYINSDYPDQTQGKYLFTYGLLQALFVQLDAINSIQESLFGNTVDFKNDYPDAYLVREMRDDVTGHPTIRRGHQFIQLAQSSLSKGGFYYLKSDSNKESGSDEFITVSIDKAIDDISKCINTLLKAAVESLDVEFAEYLKMHRDRKMKDIFNNIHFACDNVLRNDELSKWGYNSTKEMVKQFEEELNKRYGSIEVADVCAFLLKDIHELYDLIDNHLDQIPFEIRDRIKKVLIENLFSNLTQLRACAEEIDQYFDNPNV